MCLRLGLLRSPSEALREPESHRGTQLRRRAAASSPKCVACSIGCMKPRIRRPSIRTLDSTALLREGQWLTPATCRNAFQIPVSAEDALSMNQFSSGQDSYTEFHAPQSIHVQTTRYQDFA